jgi:hypothetical protein
MHRSGCRATLDSLHEHLQSRAKRHDSMVLRYLQFDTRGVCRPIKAPIVGNDKQTEWRAIGRDIAFT